MGGGGFEKGEEQLPGQQIAQDAGVLHAEGLDHSKLSYFNPCQDAFTQLLTGGEDGHQRSWGRAERIKIKQKCENNLRI